MNQAKTIDEGTDKPKRKGVGAFRLLITTIIALIIAIIYGLFASGYLKAEEIISGSMEPTILIGDRVIMSSLSTGNLKAGDVVIFEPTESNELPLIKRIAAVPGDEVYVVNNQVLVNTKPDAYLVKKLGLFPINLSYKISIPEDHYYVLGDNRMSSYDSFYFGPIHQDRIIGKAMYIYYPLSHARNLNNVEEQQKVLQQYAGK